MQDKMNFGPNWRIYWFIFFVFIMLTALFYLFAGMNLKDLMLFSIVPVSIFGYLFLTQNTLEIHASSIIQRYLLTARPSDTIKIEEIEWIALDKSEKLWLINRVFCPSVTIIKLKDGKTIKIPLSRLNKKSKAEAYFKQLGNQMADHDSEIVKLGDLHGVNQLVKDATLGLTGLLQAMQENLTRFPGQSDRPIQEKTSNLSGFIYKSIRKLTDLTGGNVDSLLAQLAPLLVKNPTNLKQSPLSPERAAVLSALNGVLGDYMSASNNPMTLPMRFRRDGRSLELNSQALKESINPINGKLLVLVHGLCMNDLQWNRQDHNHGALLAKELGYTPVYLRYNSGLHISANGRSFAELLEMLLKIWPVPVKELVLIGHSMGGLVSRSAYHYGQVAEHKWLKKITKMIFLGSPHHGAPLERGGNWVDIILGATPFTAPLARVGKIRSAGITDLRHGNIIDEHWHGRDRFERSKDSRCPVPLPKGIPCYTIAGTTGKHEDDLMNHLLGDGLVQVNSALGIHKNPELTLSFQDENQWLGYGINHMDLLNNYEVYLKIKQWLS